MDFFAVYPMPAVLAEAETADVARALLTSLQGAKNAQLVGCLQRLRERFQMPDWHNPAVVALAEAWNWLERYGLLLRDPSQSSGVHFMLSRRAEKIKTDSDFQGFLKEIQTVYDLLDESTRPRIWPIYLRGDYDTAIAQAFKEVEISMRSKAALKQSDFGERLIKKFFARFRLPGTLDEVGDTKKQSDEERLFLGAFGVYRNPAIHQPPSILDPLQAAEVLIFASHLRRLVALAEAFAGE